MGLRLGGRSHNNIIDGNSRPLIYWALPAFGVRPFKPLLDGQLPLNMGVQVSVEVNRCITIETVKQK